MKLFCVVPFYNESQYLPACITSLLNQDDAHFTLVFVDNMSTDGSAEVCKSTLRNQTKLQWTLIKEEEKGTGSAVDTGFRYAISKGATHIIRTDADCVAHIDWVSEAKRAAIKDNVLILGKLGYQTGDGNARWYDRFMFWFAAATSQLHGTLFERGDRYKTRYVFGAGHNMLISSGLYEKAGGFPRLPLDEQDDDVALFDAVRRVSPHIYRANNMRSDASLRRVRKHGYVKTMLYYWGRKYNPSVVDVR